MVQVLYLHGFASGPESQKARFFRERFQELGCEFQAPDLAESHFEDLTITGQLGVVERLAGKSPVSLIGSSLGGYLAALYAARHPEIKRAVLLAPAFGFARRWPESLGPERLAEWRRTGFLDVYHYGERCTCRLGYQLLEDGSRYEDYPEMTQPALIFHGRRDTAVPVRYSEEFASQRPQVRLEILDSDHELLDVLDDIWQKARPFLLEES